jgi:hypothetical protein
MELMEIISAIGNTSAMLIMAALFIWAYFQDKTKNQHMLEEIKEVVKALTLSNENIATSLEIISKNCASVDSKVDRNHELLVEIKSK